MFKKTAAVLGAAALVLMSGPANAVPYTAMSKGSITITADGLPMGCTSASLAGILTGLVNTPGTVASINYSTWVGCVGPAGISMVVDMKPVGVPQPWEFVGVSGGTSATNDVIVGYVDNIYFSMRSTNPLVPCSFLVVGSADAEYHERVLKAPGVYADELVINENSGNLFITNISGCLGLITGSQFDLSGTFNIT